MANKLPHMLGFIFFIISFIFTAIAFGTGYWYEAHGEDRLFRRLGLWEACFEGYEHPSDYIGKAYYGCWWIFHKEYYYIRDWILPPWFVAVQTLMTFALCLSMIGLGLYPGAGVDQETAKKETTVAVVTGLTFACICVSVVTFGTMIGEDRTWMPRPDINEPGWSFGCAVVGGFFAAFACISSTVYCLARKWDLLPKDYGDGSGKKMMPMVPRV